MNACIALRTTIHRSWRLVMLAAFIVGLLASPSSSAQAAGERVGLLFNSPAGAGDMGFNYWANQGLTQAMSDFGIAALPLTPADTTYAAYLSSLIVCADPAAFGARLCIAVFDWNNEMAKAVFDAALMFPTTHFVLLNSTYEEYPPSNNVRGVIFDTKAAGYLAGALAAKQLPGANLGAIGGMKTEAVEKWIEGFRNGAQCANTDADVWTTFTGSFAADGTGQAAAQEMIDNGVSLIYTVGGPNGDEALLWTAGYEYESGGREVLGIGVDTDEYLNLFGGGTVTGSDNLLSSTMMGLDYATYEAISAELAGFFFPGDWVAGLGGGGGGGGAAFQGGSRLAPYHEMAGNVDSSVTTYLNDNVEPGILGGSTNIDFACEPRFHAEIVENDVLALDWPAGIDLTLTVDDPDTGPNPDLMYTKPADSQGMATFGDFVYGSGAGGGPLQLAAGMYLTLSGNIPQMGGTVTKSHTIRPLDVLGVDLRVDTVGGTGYLGPEGGDRVMAQYCGESGCTHRRWATVDFEGYWAVDFSVPDPAGSSPEEANTLDIRDGTVGEVLWMDEDNDITDVQWRGTRIAARVSSNEVIGLGWAEGLTLQLGVTRGSAGYSEQQVVESRPDSTWARFDLDSNDDGTPEWTLQAGDLMWIYGLSGEGSFPRQMNVSTLAVTSINTDDAVETVSGVVEAGMEVGVDANACEAGCPASRLVTALGTDWVADFHVVGPEPYEQDLADLENGSAGEAATVDIDGDLTVVNWYVRDPRFLVRANSDDIEVWDYDLGATVDIDFDDPLTAQNPDWEESVVMEPDPWNPGGTYGQIFLDGFDIKPGMTVTTSCSSGGPTKTHTVLDPKITDVDRDNDKFGGTGTPYGTIQTYVCGGGSCAQRRVQADGDGFWSADYSVAGPNPGEEDPRDITWGVWLDAQEFDAERDGTAYGLDLKIPIMTVRANTDDVEGFNWPLGDWVTVTVDDPGTPADPDYTSAPQQVQVAGWNPDETYVLFNLASFFDILPGMEVQQDNGNVYKLHTVTDVQIDPDSINLDENLFGGNASSGDPVDTSVCGESGCDGLQAILGAGGSWQVDLDGIGWDLQAGQWIDAYQTDDDGDQSAFGYSIPLPYISVRPNEGRVDGMGFIEGHTATLEIDDLATPQFPDATQTATVQHDTPWGSGETYVGFDVASFFDIWPGMEVFVSDGTTTKMHVVSTLMIQNYNVDLNTFGGSAPQGSDVWANVCDPDGACEGLGVEAGEFDKWEVDLDNLVPPWDLEQEQWIDSHLTDADGDETAWGLNLNLPYMVVRPNQNTVEVFHAPMRWPVQLFLDKQGLGGEWECNPSGVVSGTTPWGSGETYIKFDLSTCPDPFQLEPGDYALYYDGSALKAHWVTELQMIGFDLASDTFHGTAAADSYVDTVVCGDSGCESLTGIPVNSSGNWTVDYSGFHDIKTGDWLDSWQGDGDNDSTNASIQVPNVTFAARLPNNEVHGYTWELGVPVTLRVDTGSLPGYSATAVPVLAPWDPNDTFTLFDLDGFQLEPGQLLTMTQVLPQGTLQKQHGIRDIGFTGLNLGADTMTGTIDPDILVEVDANCGTGGCEAHRDHHGDGDNVWSVDFNNPGPDEDEQTLANLTAGSYGEARSSDPDGDFTAFEWAASPIISGNAGAAGVVLNYNSGGPHSVTSDATGYYEISVPFGWTGDVTPVRNDRTFAPLSRFYASTSGMYVDQDFSILKPVPYPSGVQEVCRTPRIGVDLILTSLMRDANGSFNPATVSLIVGGVNRTSAAKIWQNASMPVSRASLIWQPTTNLPLGLLEMNFIFPVASTGSTFTTDTLTWSLNVVNMPCTENMMTSLAGAEDPAARARLEAGVAPLAQPGAVTSGAPFYNPYRRLLLLR